MMTNHSYYAGDPFPNAYVPVSSLSNLPQARSIPLGNGTYVMDELGNWWPLAEYNKSFPPTPSDLHKELVEIKEMLAALLAQLKDKEIPTPPNWQDGYYTACY